MPGSTLAEALGTEPTQTTTSLSVQAGLSAGKNNIKWMSSMQKTDNSILHSMLHVP